MKDNDIMIRNTLAEILKTLYFINMQIAQVIDMLEVKAVVKKRGGQIFRK